MDIENEPDLFILSEKLQNEDYYNEISKKIGLVDLDCNLKLLLTKFFYVLKSKNYSEIKNILDGEDDEYKAIKLIAIKIMVIKININDPDNKNIIENLSIFINLLIENIQKRYKNNNLENEKNKLSKLYNLNNQVKNLVVKL